MFTLSLNILNFEEYTYTNNKTKTCTQYILVPDFEISQFTSTTQRIVYFECANIEICNVQALIQQNNSLLIRGILF
jgi:hypothetical protein